MKPITLSRTKVSYLFGASLKTNFSQFEESTSSFKGIPSELIEIETPEIRVGKNDSGEYAEIVIPEEFNPGSIMVFATDMDVRLFLLPLLASGSPLSASWLASILQSCRTFIPLPALATIYRSNALADKQEMSPDLDTTIQSGANEAFAELDLVDLNVILHRADGEEKDATGMFLYSLLLFFLLHSYLPLSVCPPLTRSSPPPLAPTFLLAILIVRRRRSLHHPRLRIPSLLRS